MNAESLGGTMYAGPGAGAKPTSNSVLTDIIDIARGKIFNYQEFVKTFLIQVFKIFHVIVI